MCPWIRLLGCATNYQECGRRKQHTCILSQWVRSPGSTKLGPLLRAIQAASHGSTRNVESSLTAVGGIPNLTAVELTGACFFTAQRRQVSLLLESSEDPESVSHPLSSALFPGQHPPFWLTQRQLIRDLDSICKIPLPLPCNGTCRQVPATRRRRRWQGTYAQRRGEHEAGLGPWLPPS